MPTTTLTKAPKRMTDWYMKLSGQAGVKYQRSFDGNFELYINMNDKGSGYRGVTLEGVNSKGNLSLFAIIGEDRWELRSTTSSNRGDQNGQQ
jgi:hypothetical protein